MSGTASSRFQSPRLRTLLVGAALVPPLLALGASPTQAQFVYGVDPQPSLTLTTTEPGQSGELEVGSQAAAGELETFRIVVTIPDEFTFEGFPAPAGPNGQVGEYGIDVGPDGTIDIPLPVRSLKQDAAYVDADLDSLFLHGFEALIEHGSGPQTIATTVPLGGDGSPATIVTPLPARTILQLSAGVLTNPTAPGLYTLTAVFTSVDPDTGGPDDGQGDPPLNFSTDLSFTIGDGVGGVPIDLKPESNPNCVNPDAGGLTSVAIFSTDDFDATTIDPSTAVFGDASAKRCKTEDVPMEGPQAGQFMLPDGILDLVCKFRVGEVTWPAPGEDCDAISLEATAVDGEQLMGSDLACLAGESSCAASVPLPLEAGQ